MIRSLFTAATGMSAQQMDQDVVANNLANVNTVGFKKSRANFQDLMYQVYSKAGATGSTGTQLPAGIEVGMGVKPISTQKIFSQGDYQQTGNTFVNFAEFFSDGQICFVQNCYARAVVAAIFQPPQSFQQDGRGRFFSDISDDSTHKTFNRRFRR